MMNNPNAIPAGPAARWSWRLLAALAAATALALGCGGGVGTGGTGTFASGPISGYGSIIVNDVHFDEAAASVLDDDGDARPRTDLRLGVTVDIDAGEVSSPSGTPTASARSVRIGSALLGPVEAVDAAAGRLTVLGQTVLAGPDTVIDDALPGGLAGIVPGRVLEIYALIDPARGGYRATRIEPRDGASAYHLRGLVDSLESGSTLRIGNARFDYAGASPSPGDLGAGALVRVRLQTGRDGQGRFVVGGFGTAVRAPADRDAARLEGIVTSLASTASFRVNGVQVDASSAAFPDGSAGLVVGARVQAEGQSVAGVLRAARVSLKSEAQLGERFELDGAIVSVDSANHRFVLRGITVVTTRPDLRLDNGTLADIAVNRLVEVRGSLSADRTRLEATRITFK